MSDVHVCVKSKVVGYMNEHGEPWCQNECGIKNGNCDHVAPPLQRLTRCGGYSVSLFLPWAVEAYIKLVSVERASGFILDSLK